MKWLVLVFVLCSAPLVAQQTVINPKTAEFTPSPDHGGTRLDGTPIVVSYELNAVAPSPAGAMALTANIGKPAPNAAGLIIVTLATLSQWATLTPNTLYSMTVTAKGPDGNAVSTASNFFGNAAPQIPRTAGKPVLR